MEWFDNIRKKIGWLMLRNAIQTTQQPKKVPPIDSIESIGIVYDATSNESEKDVQNFASLLRENGKKVHLIGYVNSKQIPFGRKIHIQSEYFSNEHVNYFFLPVKSKIGRFLTSEFDVLIGMYIEQNISLLAISSYTKARYKISSSLGKYSKTFDMEIELNDQKNLLNLGNQIYHYLQSIS